MGIFREIEPGFEATDVISGGDRIKDKIQSKDHNEEDSSRSKDIPLVVVDAAEKIRPRLKSESLSTAETESDLEKTRGQEDSNYSMETDDAVKSLWNKTEEFRIDAEKELSGDLKGKK